MIFQFKRIRMNSFVLTHQPLSESIARNALADNACGAVVIFVGNVRDSSKGVGVTHLEFEAYESMVMKVLDEIASELRLQMGVHGVLLHHRLGRVEVGDAAVIAGVSAAHRTEAFAACEMLMNRLKQTVPIWKKEFTTEGSVWVSQHP